MRLREHRKFRRVLELQSVPDYTTLYGFLKRLDDKKIDQALGEAARRMRLLLHGFALGIIGNLKYGVKLGETRVELIEQGHDSNGAHGEY